MDSEFGEIIGRSDAMYSVLKQVEMVAQSDSTVLILGETGTGKELIARAIHNLSNRNSRRMVKMNCAAMPAGLLESDLFGHERGAFTGASSQRLGRFELADKSSLFLDEVGDMPLELQPKLLRVLQEQEFERLGSNKLIQTDVRLIAATNRDLKNGRRPRVSQRSLLSPERLPDLPAAARAPGRYSPAGQSVYRQDRASDGAKHRQHSCRDVTYPFINGVARQRARAGKRHRACGAADARQCAAALLPEVTLPDVTVPAAETAKEGEDEYQLIMRVLKETNGVVAGPKGAAQRLGLKRTTLLSRMKRLGIDKESPV